MAFGQASGPPATGKQLRELLEMLNAAGHVDFRDARGPLGFTQRQAGGKFTRDEAEAFIEMLEAELNGEGSGEALAPPEAGTVKPKAPKAPKASAPAPPTGGSWRDRTPSAPKTPDLSGVSAEDLAAELQLRGWIVAEP